MPPRLSAPSITGQAGGSHCSASRVEFGKTFCIHAYTHVLFLSWVHRPVTMGREGTWKVTPDPILQTPL